MKLFSGDDKGKIVYSALDLDQVIIYYRNLNSHLWFSESMLVCLNIQQLVNCLVSGIQLDCFVGMCTLGQVCTHPARQPLDNLHNCLFFYFTYYFFEKVSSDPSCFTMFPSEITVCVSIQISASNFSLNGATSLIHYID